MTLPICKIFSAIEFSLSDGLSRLVQLMKEDISASEEGLSAGKVMHLYEWSMSTDTIYLRFSSDRSSQ